MRVCFSFCPILFELCCAMLFATWPLKRETNDDNRSSNRGKIRSSKRRRKQIINIKKSGMVWFGRRRTRLVWFYNRSSHLWGKNENDLVTKKGRLWYLPKVFAYTQLILLDDCQRKSTRWKRLRWIKNPPPHPQQMWMCMYWESEQSFARKSTRWH